VRGLAVRCLLACSLVRMVWLTLFTLEPIFKGLEYATGSSREGTTHVGCTRYQVKKPDTQR
jgi:hypothetical protein